MSSNSPVRKCITACLSTAGPKAFPDTIIIGPAPSILPMTPIPVRKPNKLPAATISESYDLEYGTDTIEIHADAIEKGAKVLFVDDLLATGGTAKASCDLIKKVGGELVGAAFLIELEDLHGRDRLKDCGKVISMIQY